MPKRTKKPKTPKVTKQSQHVKQSVIINQAPRRRNVGLQKVAQRSPQPQPNLSFVSNVTAPKQSNDTSLLFRELYETKQMIKKLQHASPFERALASTAAQDDRMLQVEQMKMAESDPIRRAVLGPKSDAERLGLEVGTTPQKIGSDKAIGEQGVMGVSDDKRLTQGEYLQQRQPAHALSAEFIREQRLFNLKKPHNTLERVIGRAEDLHTDPTTIEEALRGQKLSTKDQLEAASEESIPIDTE